MMETVKAITLIIQLFLSNGEEARGYFEHNNSKTCLEEAHKALDIREYEGKKVVAVGAGCYMQLHVDGDPEL